LNSSWQGVDRVQGFQGVTTKADNAILTLAKSVSVCATGTEGNKHGLHVSAYAENQGRGGDGTWIPN
jgi:hypothetical protein